MRTRLAAALFIALVVVAGACGSDAGDRDQANGTVSIADSSPELTTTTVSDVTSMTSKAVENEGVPCEASMLLEAARAAEAIEPSAHVTVDAHRCVEIYAYANFSLANGDGADAYFRYAVPGMGWRLIDLGSDVETSTLGIPHDVLAQLVMTEAGATVDVGPTR